MKEAKEKKDIIKHLKENILTMEGFGVRVDSRQHDFGLGVMNKAFPGEVFPTGVIHEFISLTEACAAATGGFLSFILNTLMKKGGTCLWISAGRKLFPPALKFFGIEPHRIIFIDVRRDKDALWAMEQGLKCKELAAVVAELKDISFAESRRLQLAVENSRVTGFLHRSHPRSENTLACVSRWKIKPLPSHSGEGLPGIGFACMEVELEKIRNGKPGIWQLEWKDGTFRDMTTQKQKVQERGFAQKRKHYA